MSMNKNAKPLFSILVLLGICTVVHDWAGETHKALTEKAIFDSDTGDYLKDCLGIGQGLSCLSAGTHKDGKG